LRLMCLSEGFAVDISAVNSILAKNEGVVSASILDLQYWCLSGMRSLRKKTEETKLFPPEVVAAEEDGLDTSCRDPQAEQGGEDVVAKLLSVTHDQLNETPSKVVVPADDCLQALLPSEKREEIKDGAQLVQWLPLPRVAKAAPDSKKKYVAKAAEPFDFFKSPRKRKKEEEEKAAADSAPPTRVERSRAEAKNARLALDAIHSCIDFDHLAGPEMRYARRLSLIAAKNSLKSLKQDLDELQIPSISCEAEEPSLSDLLGERFRERTTREVADGVEAGKKALAAASPENYVVSTSSWLETLPALRQMARYEADRKATAEAGGGKKSRSGRFLHYFNQNDIYLEDSEIGVLRDTLL